MDNPDREYGRGTRYWVNPSMYSSCSAGNSCVHTMGGMGNTNRGYGRGTRYGADPSAYSICLMAIVVFKILRVPPDADGEGQELEGGQGPARVESVPSEAGQ